MNFDPQTIDRVVAEVVRRLSLLADQTPMPKSAPSGASSVTTSEPVRAAPSAPAAKLPSDTLTLDAHVVTTATIHGRLEGIRRVVVGARAIVTPSVRDELQKRHVQLERQEDVVASATGAGDLTVVRCTRAADAARALSILPLPNKTLELTVTELKAAVTDAAQAVSDPARVAVLMTDETLAAACLLNRKSHVRAAAVRSVDDVRCAVSAIGVNVLVVDPRDLTANQWSGLVQLFRTGLPRGAPAGM